jgi:hypothetical protein
LLYDAIATFKLSAVEPEVEITKEYVNFKNDK